MSNKMVLGGAVGVAVLATIFFNPLTFIAIGAISWLGFKAARKSNSIELPDTTEQAGDMLDQNWQKLQRKLKE